MGKIAKDIAELEAVLFAAGDPLARGQLAKLLGAEPEAIPPLVERLKDSLDRRESGLTVRKVAGGWQLVTRPEHFHVLEKLSEVADKKLSAPAMETLSIVAFKQPITKQEIEQIRGVRVEHSLAKLLELDLVTEKGRKQVLGRPILYGTTDTFLKAFGLDSLEDLPALPQPPTLEEAKAGLDEKKLRMLQELEDAQRAANGEGEPASASGDGAEGPALPEPGNAEAAEAPGTDAQAGREEPARQEAPWEGNPEVHSETNRERWQGLDQGSDEDEKGNL